MKKNILISILLVCSTNFIFAQNNDSEEKYSFAFDIAPSVTWFTNTNSTIDINDGARAKFSGGFTFYANYASENKVSVFTGINYNSYGGWLKSELLPLRARYAFQEIEIPVGVRLRSNPLDGWRIAFHAGLGLGITTIGKATLPGQYKNKNFDYKPSPLRATYQFAIGAEYNLQIVAITAKIRYQGGISNSYFYRGNQIFKPINVLDLQQTHDALHETITFRPSMIELVLGVIL